MARKLRTFTSLILIAGVATFGRPLHAEDMKPTEQPTEEQGLIEELKLFSKAIGAIHEGYAGDTIPRQLFYDAVKGMIASLDKYCQFFDPQQNELLQIYLRGEYAGVGIILETVDNYPAVRSVKPDSAAAKAGIYPMDKILKIDGESMEKKAIPDVAKLLRGEADSSVKLTILRLGNPEPFDIEIKREKIEIEAVHDAKMITKTTGYIQIAGFTEKTAEQTRSSLEKLKKQGMKNIIIDLRNNDGGLMPQALELAELFFDKDQKIVSVQSKLPEQQKEYISSGKKKIGDYKVVILVNHVTASASEIFSASMQDHKRAIVVGSQTFGKASVQSLVPLDDKTSMKLTTARYTSPNGRQIDGVGLTPDHVVEDTSNGGLDLPLVKALSLLEK